MPHPFFDANVYPWKRDDAIKLHVALYSAINAPAQIALLYGQSGGTLPRSPGLAAHLAWAEVIDLLTAGRNLQALCAWCSRNRRGRRFTTSSAPCRRPCPSK